jgi:hypothetical protein
LTINIGSNTDGHSWTIYLCTLWDSCRYYLRHLIRKMAGSSSEIRNWVNMKLDTLHPSPERLGRNVEAFADLTEVEKALWPERGQSLCRPALDGRGSGSVGSRGLDGGMAAKQAHQSDERPVYGGIRA